MKRIQHQTINLAKGALIGAGAIIPGLSGGTMAVITGVFEDILHSAVNIVRRPKREILFLLPFGLGGIIAVFVFSPLIEIFCSKYPTASNVIFCLISLYSAVLFAKQSITRRVTAKKSIALLFGVISSLLINYILRGYTQTINTNSFITVFLTGLPLAAALVLPAISFSYMMLFFGIYDEFLHSLSTFDASFLLALSSGLIVGCYVFSKIMLNLINNHSQETYCYILGFVLCSIINIIL